MPLTSRPAVRRGLAVVALVLALVALGAPPAPAGGGPQLTLDPAAGRAGTIVDASGTGFPAGFEALLRLDDPEGGPVLADGVAVTSRGTFEVALVIPRGVPAGDHVVHACLRDPGTPEPICGRMPSARLQVLAQLAGRVTTGGPPVAWGAAGLMVLAVLGAGVAVRRGQAARTEGAR